MKNEKVQNFFSCTTVINAKFLHNVWASEKLKSSLNFFFFTENNSQRKKSRSASGKYLAGVVPRQLNFDGAKLIFFEFPEEKKYKIQNFKLKVIFFFESEIFERGGQISKVLFGPENSKFQNLKFLKNF
jgi:hypothetical protein